jgi:hypothetical protein
MRNFISSQPKHKQSLYVKPLITCFESGWLLTILVFSFFRPQIHQFIDPIL